LNFAKARPQNPDLLSRHGASEAGEVAHVKLQGPNDLEAVAWQIFFISSKAVIF
jgi:hypothetical protein